MLTRLNCAWRLFQTFERLLKSIWFPFKGYWRCNAARIANQSLYPPICSAIAAGHWKNQNWPPQTLQSLLHLQRFRGCLCWGAKGCGQKQEQKNYFCYKCRTTNFRVMERAPEFLSQAILKDSRSISFHHCKLSIICSPRRWEHYFFPFCRGCWWMLFLIEI